MRGEVDVRSSKKRAFGRPIVLFAMGVVSVFLLGPARADEPSTGTLSVLIVDGMNNHDWERATRLLKSILLASGRFKVDVATSPAAKAPASEWDQWRPPFSRYDVVLMN